MGLPTTEEEK